MPISNRWRIDTALSVRSHGVSSTVTNLNTQTALRLLAALSQDCRLAIYRLLVQQGPDGMAAGTIAERLDVAAATLSFHLKELAHAELVTPRQEGRYIYYSANYESMNGLIAFLTENCCGEGTAVQACVPSQQR